MIFVSVGTIDKSFNRLIKAVDKIAGKTGDRILVQIGFSTYVPQQCEFFRFCNHEEMLSHIKAASLVISHSGFGIIGNSIKLKKPILLVPREIAYGEAIDKQYELAEYLASQNESILCVRDVSILPDAIERLRDVQVCYNYKTTIPALIDSFISITFLNGK